MKKYQAKSPCCGKGVVRFGSRRRQCILCHKTWRIRKKKVGRKRRRISTELLTAFLSHDIASLASLSKKKGVSDSLIQKRMERSRDTFIQKTSWPALSEGLLILIVDAVVELIESKWRTVYLTLVRSISGDRATIMPPLILRGTETPEGWHEAIERIEKTTLLRIKAVVCDGHRGILCEARDRKWIIQRCHFHLLARIQSRRSRFAIARHKDEANQIFHHVGIVLHTADSTHMQESLNILEEIGWLSKSKEIRNVLKGFTTNYRDFRSYMTYPELNLPTTSNTAESLASMIGYLKIRMRGFPTMHSFVKWIIALLKFRQSIQCRKHQPH